MIGVSLVTGINLGLSNLVGSCVPMIILGTYPPARVLVVLLLGPFGRCDCPVKVGLYEKWK